MTINDLLTDNPLWIVDIGASGGIDPRWPKLTSSFKGILFEPDPREYEDLRSKAGKNLIVLNSALSDSVNTMNFNLCRKQEVSSVYLPNTKVLKKFPDSERFEVNRTITLTTDTLNNQLRKNGISEIDFIKIDTQGHELPILSGSSDYIDKVVGLEIEVEFIELYKGQPLFYDVNHFTQKNGFELFDIRRYFWKRKEGIHTGRQKGQLIFGDALYFRTPENIMSMKDISPEKIIRSICIYLSYGYLDLAQALLKNANDDNLLARKICKKITTILSRLSRHERKKIIPNFKGKRKIQKLFEKSATIFSVEGWSSGTDKTLGNT